MEESHVTAVIWTAEEFRLEDALHESPKRTAKSTTKIQWTPKTPQEKAIFLQLQTEAAASHKFGFQQMLLYKHA